MGGMADSSSSVYRRDPQPYHVVQSVERYDVHLYGRRFAPTSPAATPRRSLICVPGICAVLLWACESGGAGIEVDAVRQIPSIITGTQTVPLLGVLKNLGMSDGLTTA